MTAKNRRLFDSPNFNLFKRRSFFLFSIQQWQQAMHVTKDTLMFLCFRMKICYLFNTHKTVCFSLLSPGDINYRVLLSCIRFISFFGENAHVYARGWDLIVCFQWTSDHYCNSIGSIYTYICVFTRDKNDRE